ncbi:Pregnancy-associated plasma protein-A [Candidatus Nitrosocosmicus oleophilus]|jgi:hypothetical protein|uniref:Pregnancy-associated plasma protein-A n=1 Tax=Candidatus Nitrosocosmicus oleophilus TaxID=1353260 RepID=A0A654M495_9ARCH|nr:M43 family zinc metalloprotease [Candidatus Nitrosocosmicus oleophilus]ALI37391.1 Pregnancy-associated plasma protein-A [Candidatus Nitrosocosmicus oleophilus]
MPNHGFYCNTDYYNKPPSKSDKSLIRQIKLEESKKKSLTKYRFIRNLPLYDIPIVFHIIYHEDIEKIKKSQILKQFDSLNKDFRNKNIDNVLFSKFPKEKALATDSKLNFIFPKNDPSGNPTDGITFTHTSNEFFESFTESGSYSLEEQPVKSTESGGHDAWNTAKYLNVWVCKLSSPGGYAQYPRKNRYGDLVSTDGVVIDYRYFGMGKTTQPGRDKGKTLTHEVGHWLGLYHLWGPSDSPECEADELCDYTGDEICDTPPQIGAQCGSPIGYSSEQKCPGCPDPIALNFMDGWDDEYALMFTRDQVARMRGYLEKLRPTIIS